MSARLWTEEQFNCPVCLDLPHDPVTIPCGHSYCMECIKDYWGKDDHIGIYSCPQCRQTFCPKPSLSRNTMLAEAVEQLRRGASRASITSIRRPRAAQNSSGSSSAPRSSSSSTFVPCDVCQGDPHPAVKTCLVCLASYCETHLKPHCQAPALKRHELISPTGQLTQKICAQHKYLQEFYCRRCQAFICWLCTSNQHKDHETASTQAVRVERQKELGDVQTETQVKLQEREKELKEMKKVVESLKRSADRVHADTELVLTELQRSVERLQELVEEVMDSIGQEKLREAQEVVEKLEAEIRELKRKDSEMKDLITCEDNIHFLQNCKSLCSPPEAGELPTVTANPDASFEPVRTAMLDLRDKVEDLCNQELSQATKTVNDLVAFTLVDNKANKNAAPRFKFEFLKIFSGLGSKTAEKRDPAPAAPSVGVRSAERRGPVSGVRSQDVRSREEPRAERGSGGTRDVGRRVQARDVVSSQQGEMEPRRRANPSPTPPAADAVAGDVVGLQGMVAGNLFLQAQPTQIGNTAGLNTWGAGAGMAATAALVEQGVPNPSLFLDSPSEALPTHAFPALREIPIQSLQAPAPKSRAEFLQYACRLTLDPDTAHRRLCLSEGNTKATLQGTTQPCPDLPQRFDSWTQVLCRDALPGDRCYWEVEWRGRGSSVGVAYSAIARKGGDARAGLGYNALSWSLELSDTCCCAMHHNEKHDIAVGYTPRVGVFLDRRAGTLAFYSVSDNMAPLHTFQGSFVEPLFPAFGVGSGVGVGLDFALGQFSSLSDSIKICPI
ncbi:E3 ubiquitin/ISG15 ligase TRIM25 [Megalops cyprinoides]|uniref:E3 ubiquitin/ISG15 ligase TRIM25 n=1 Tax=Megalops cyprinoides TaxID=118141 RepID=UPI00186466BC|nr:E3 ubiquitin/ISG15 ligase TRIM25 [Megalops cyprinoides]